MTAKHARPAREPAALPGGLLFWLSVSFRPFFRQRHAHIADIGGRELGALHALRRYFWGLARFMHVYRQVQRGTGERPKQAASEPPPSARSSSHGPEGGVLSLGRENLRAAVGLCRPFAYLNPESELDLNHG